MLRVTLLGNLGGEPEIRYSARGTQFVQFTVAVNQVRTGPDGERQENTEWFRVRRMGKSAEYLQRLSKGTRVLVVGRLDIGRYQSKDGETRTSFDVWADEVQNVSVGRQSGADVDRLDPDAEGQQPALAGAAANARGSRGAARSEAAAKDGATEDLEDLPF
jgi:single-strand DNA-binding protein